MSLFSISLPVSGDAVSIDWQRTIGRVFNKDARLLPPRETRAESNNALSHHDNFSGLFPEKLSFEFYVFARRCSVANPLGTISQCQ